MLANCGYKIDWGKISKDHWLEANICRVDLNYKPIENIMSDCLVEF
ncbi:MAG: hypothetical protein OCD02_11490 [Spirochaetaceae bacterium]